jgi:hypothetical protein
VRKGFASFFLMEKLVRQHPLGTRLARARARAQRSFGIRPLKLFTDNTSGFSAAKESLTGSNFDSKIAYCNDE